MKTSRIAPVIMAVLAAATMSAYATASSSCGMADMAPKHKTSVGKKAPSNKKLVSAICPVMGTKIPDITKAAGKSVYKGKTYYFCCGMCKPAFDKNPAKYAK
ncbi:MAG: YHS domain-containing protein [Armatimonadota bacterium]